MTPIKEKEPKTDFCKDCPEEPYRPNCDENFPCPYVTEVIEEYIEEEWGSDWDG